MSFRSFGSCNRTAAQVIADPVTVTASTYQPSKIYLTKHVFGKETSLGLTAYQARAVATMLVSAADWIDQGDRDE